MALLPEDPQKRKVVLYGVLIVAGILAVWYFLVLEPNNERIQAQQTHHDRLSQQVRLIEEAALDDVTTERLARHVEAVEALIPSQEDLPRLLDDISSEAMQAGVDLSAIRPAGTSEGEHYTRQTYDLAALGSYHRIGDFLARIGSLSRIVTPIDLQLQPATARDGDDPREPRLRAQFSIETYVTGTGGGEAR